MISEAVDVERVARLVESRSSLPWSAVLRQLGLPLRRPQVTRAALAAYFADHPALIESWLRYSGDKRTSEGWYFETNGIRSWVGRISSHTGKRGADEATLEYFDSLATACSEFVVRELAITGHDDR